MEFDGVIRSITLSVSKLYHCASFGPLRCGRNGSRRGFVPSARDPLDALKALSAAQKPADVMVLDRSFLNQLPQYDGFMFGMPTHFGMMPVQMKAFFDGTGGLVGQEITHFTALTQLVHHGMVYVPLG